MHASTPSCFVLVTTLAGCGSGAADLAQEGGTSPGLDSGLGVDAGFPSDAVGSGQDGASDSAAAGSGVDAGVGSEGGAATEGDAATNGPDSGGAAPSSNPWISFDPSTIVAESNVVLARPNSQPTQLMPVGNGTLGAAVWAAGGFTAQINRGDTWPDRKSSGWLTIPGLATMTGASDFKGTLDLYNGVLSESGGGMTARIYVRADSDELILDVTGADPTSMQTATVSLWSGRSPNPQASGAIATLSETWSDNSEPGSSGQTFGSLVALTAGGEHVKASTQGTMGVTVSFQPNADGSFRVVCGAPSYNGSTAAATAGITLLGSDATTPSATLQSTHEAWWHDYWGRIGLVKMTSSDDSAAYIENLRAMYYYVTAAESRGHLPGSQAGIADLFNHTRDSQDWVPGDFWFWNLRMQVAANLSGGAFDMNAPVFNLYASNVMNIEAWTKAKMGGRAGICVPETMRFNGNGSYSHTSNDSCDQTIAPSYNSRTLSSGTEVSLWMWQQYQMTGDMTLLQTNYSIMSQAATFLLAYASTASDGLLHTQANAHETQWNVTDPITDVAAMRALFPAVISAAQLLGTDTALVTQLQAAVPKLPDYPRTDMATRSQVLTASSDGSGNDILYFSTQPTAAQHNSENLGLEPVWPYNLITDANSSEFALAQRTYTSRPFVNSNDWSMDSIHAARMQMANEVSKTIRASIATYQVYPCGLSAWNTSAPKEPYVEEDGVIATAVNEALVQDFDGTVRIAPAWPTTWSGTGSVFIQGESKVDVQFQNGSLSFAVLDAGSTGTFRVKNPWGTTQLVVIDGSNMQTVVPATGSAVVTISAQAGHSYLIKRSSDPTPAAVAVRGTPATAVKTLGSRSIGIQ